MAQYWVVNNSPPGSGPGGAAYTSYAIVRGSQQQAENIPNAGGISGPYRTLKQAYEVWKNEPGNQDVSTLTKIGQYIGTAVGFAIYSTTNPTAVVQAGQTGGNAATNIIPGLKDIGDFFHRLTEKATWIRFGEVLAGGIVLYVGVKSLTSGTPVGEAARQGTSTAKKLSNAIPQARAARAVRQARTAKRVREASRYKDVKGNIKVTRG